MRLILLVLFVSLASINKVNCARVLFVLPIASRSETHLFQPIAFALMNKGHEIVFVAPNSVKGATLPGKYRVVTPVAPVVDEDFFVVPDPIEERKLAKNKLSYIASSDMSFMIAMCEDVWNDPDFKDLLKEKFDLIFMSGFFNNCFDGLVDHFKVPFVMMTSMPTISLVSRMTTGFGFPPSFVPVSILDYTDSMSFLERVCNTLIVWMVDSMDLMFHGVGTQIYRKHLGQQTPESWKIEKNASFLFSNSHPLLNFPRPGMPNLIEVGGIHCQDAKPLPKDLEDYVSGAKDGFIMFSMGTVLNPDKFPVEMRNMFASVFGKLKQKVVWKWNEESFPNLPKNVKLVKWLPQQDMLGHKNIKMFITHGGLLSTMEAAYHGVPLIGLPVAVDQDVNIIKAEKLGFAIFLEILELNEEKILNAIQAVLTNASYTKSASRVSSIFKDHPDKGPLERVVYWTEYALKYSGAEHLQSPARHLNFVQFNSYDVLAFVLLILLILVYVSYRIMRFVFVLCTSLFGTRKNGVTHRKSKTQ